jgi:multidrug efflux pump subunit AcrB
MQGFTRFFVDRWQFTLIVFVMLFGLGIQSVMSIPKSEDPIVSFPGVGVFVVLPGGRRRADGARGLDPDRDGAQRT